jgi:hypothetical protein
MPLPLPVPVPFNHRLWSACVLFVFCLCSACVLFVFCLCSACVLLVFYLCSGFLWGFGGGLQVSNCVNSSCPVMLPTPLYQLYQSTGCIACGDVRSVTTCVPLVLLGLHTQPAVCGGVPLPVPGRAAYCSHSLPNQQEGIAIVYSDGDACPSTDGRSMVFHMICNRSGKVQHRAPALHLLGAWLGEKLESRDEEEGGGLRQLPRHTARGTSLLSSSAFFLLVAAAPADQGPDPLVVPGAADGYQVTWQTPLACPTLVSFPWRCLASAVSPFRGGSRLWREANGGAVLSC